MKSIMPVKNQMPKKDATESKQITWHPLLFISAILWIQPNSNTCTHYRYLYAPLGKSIKRKLLWLLSIKIIKIIPIHHLSPPSVFHFFNNPTITSSISSLDIYGSKNSFNFFALKVTFLSTIFSMSSMLCSNSRVRISCLYQSFIFFACLFDILQFETFISSTTQFCSSCPKMKYLYPEQSRVFYCPP